ncbi:MAG: DNA methyltransferase [Chloroflexi bacterium]|nr:DNA methyltransferase [Chloroflexota bacterium]
MTIETLKAINSVHSDRNKLRSEDRAVHDWYRFVLSFPPHLVRDYLERLGVGPSDTVLDPFCGTGTTLVECKKLGIASVGIESNPMAHFASLVKVDWSVDASALSEFAEGVAVSTQEILDRGGSNEWVGLPLLATKGGTESPMRQLDQEQSKLLLKDSISPRPLHKTLVLLEEIDRHGDLQMRQKGRLALAKALTHRIGNLKFGPEVGLGRIKDDAPVVETWIEGVREIAHDVGLLGNQSQVASQVLKADSREASRALEPNSVDAVITSPPYPNEKDYTRTTRLESVVLGLIRDRRELRSLKQDLIRSNTRGVYKSDTDDLEVSQHPAIQEIATAIERRRIELGKTSGFERLYPRVTQLYFGGMARHLASLRPVLRPGARLAYVVGDQASYLRVMIRTGQILADLAQSLGYRVVDIDLFRTRPSTVTGEQLREEVVVLKWLGE